MIQKIIAQILLLAITAVFAEAGECTIGDTVEPTIPFIISGQFINLNSPAVCSGNLTAWHFCYYRSSIDTDAPPLYTLWFRVWRNIGGNTYTLVSNTLVQRTPNRTAGDLKCEDRVLAEDEYVQVQQGDVISVYVPFTLPKVSILAFQPPVTQELQQDTRSSSAFSATQFRRNELRSVTDYGLHLTADIDFFDPPTMATTTSRPTTTTNAITTQGSIVSGTNSNTGLQSVTTLSPIGNNNDGAVVAAIVVVLLLLVVGVAIGVTVFIICYSKRKHGSLQGCLQSSRSKLLAMDNLIYRVGSDRIPVHIPKKSKRPTVNEGSQPYDIPRDRHNRTLYDIPKNNTTSEDGSVNYSVVSPFSQSVSTLHSSEYNTVPQRRAQDQQTSEGVNGLTTSQKKNEQDYIYMDNNDKPDNARDDPQNKDRERGGDEQDEEVYIYLRYGTVEYHKLLSQATKGEERDTESPFRLPPSNEDEIYVVLSEQQIKVVPRKAVNVQDRLGSGQFGNVHKGIWKGSKGTLQVAVKSLAKDASQTDKVRLLQEAAIMGQFHHPNITHLHGIVTQGEPLLLVLEYMLKGDLKRYLTKLRPEPNMLIPATVPQRLISFSQQVALGMHYLASKGFVHRDLAARNIFVSEEDTCKIGDFGMSRDLTEEGCYLGHGGKVPIKWTAPEAIHQRKYSIASDVWSYGCLLYEIWSLGGKPFRGIDSTKVIQLIDGGYRLPPPPGCPQVIYDLMIKCWHPVSASRPKYRDILTSLLQDERKLRDIPVEDASTHPEACLLGAPIEAGKHMYAALQHCYNPDATDEHDPDYEYGEIDGGSQ